MPVKRIRRDPRRGRSLDGTSSQMSNRADRADVLCLYNVALPNQNLALGFPPWASGCSLTL